MTTKDNLNGIEKETINMTFENSIDDTMERLYDLQDSKINTKLSMFHGEIDHPCSHMSIYDNISLEGHVNGDRISRIRDFPLILTKVPQIFSEMLMKKCPMPSNDYGIHDQYDIISDPYFYIMNKFITIKMKRNRKNFGVKIREYEHMGSPIIDFLDNWYPGIVKPTRGMTIPIIITDDDL